MKNLSIVLLIISTVLVSAFAFFQHTQIGVSTNAQAINSNCNSSNPLWSDSFSSGWEDRFGIYGSYDVENRELVNDPVKGDVLRVNYPIGTRNPGTANAGGTGFKTSQFDPADELCFSYDLKFKDGFDFVRGGKLPGLAGGTANTGGNIPNGTDGFSARYMWRVDGAGEVYAYLPSSQNYGTSLGAGSWVFDTNRWYNITQYVKLNTPGENDGQITVFIDNNQVYSVGNLNFRSVSSLQIDQILFSTFFGGNDDSWSTTRDEYIDFANMEIYEASSKSIQIKVLLEGSLIQNNGEYNSEMRNLISQFNTDIPNEYIDTVDVELKDINKNLIQSKEFYLDSDGYLIDKSNGSKDLIFENIASDLYYINIKHRNHIGIGTVNPIDFSTSQFLDFSTSNNTINQNQKLLPNGKFALNFGNVNGDSIRNSTDRNEIINTSSEIFTYSNYDINMDSVINSTDRNLAIDNQSLIEYLN